MTTPGAHCSFCGAPRPSSLVGACVYCGVAFAPGVGHVEVAAANFLTREEHGVAYGSSQRVVRTPGPEGLRLMSVPGDPPVAALVVETQGPFVDVGIEAVYVPLSTAAEVGVRIRRSSRGSYNVKVGSDRVAAVERVVVGPSGVPELSWIGDTNPTHGKAALGQRTHLRVSMTRSRIVVIVDDRVCAVVDDATLTNGKASINLTARSDAADEVVLERFVCLIPAP